MNFKFQPESLRLIMEGKKKITVLILRNFDVVIRR